jgi:hypothetical protein
MFKILIQKKEDLLNIKDLVKNDLIICVPYYEHKMNSFQNLLQIIMFY